LIVNEIPSPFADPRIAFAAVREGATPDELFAEELAVYESFSNEKRRREFLDGRRAAHAAMRMVSAASGVARNPDRTPKFPDGLVGSISHSGSLSVAAVAQSGDFVAIGIDVQIIRDLDAHSICAKICSQEETAWVDGSAERVLQIFSAKEAVYKAVYSGFGTSLTAAQIRLSASQSPRWEVKAGSYQLWVQGVVVKSGQESYALSGVSLAL
jgi:4'-phosphopantetheinyl transferase EntD